LLNKNGRGRFKAYSAGSHPNGRVNPHALDLLQRLGFDTAELRSKAWDEFAAPGAPELDFVFTVCDSAAGEVCPVWPGQPMTAHWGLPDPAAVEGPDLDKANAFRETFRALERRISLFTALPLSSLDRMSLTNKIREIGKS
jgi:arsenate reductase